MSPVLAPPGTERVELQLGHGLAKTYAGRYPLGALTFVRAAAGRGLISLEASSGTFDLGGSQADDLGGGRWRLHIDRAAILAVSAARGGCELVMRSAPPSYASLSCTVLIGSDPRPITVEWRGDGSAAKRVR